MIADAERIDASVCIVGAGAAGLTLAAELLAKGHDVCVLERGVQTSGYPTTATAENVGVASWPIDAALGRGVGGTLRHWRGICRALAPQDFAPRDWMPASGWPLTRDVLAPFQRRAHELLGVADPFDEREWNDAWRGAPMDLGSTALEHAAYALADVGRLPRVLAPRVLGSARARVIDDCTVIGIDDGDANAVVHGRRRDGVSLRVRAEAVVLAAGALENTRLLLEAGLGNAWVGRCFMDHPHALLGLVRDADEDRLAPYLEVGCGAGGFGRLLLQLRASHLAHARCPGASVMLERTPRSGVVALLARTEQSPHPDSRVRLADRGARLEVEWRLQPLDRRAMDELLAACTDAFRREGTGEVIANAPERADEWPAPMVGGCHHMGTTRMADSPASGAVDPNGRLFEHARIYVAGSSLFPTSGVANPTSTIVALALRLAHHLASDVLTGNRAVPVVSTPAWTCDVPIEAPDETRRTEAFIRTIVAATAARVDELVAWDRVTRARLAVFDLDGTLLELHTEALLREVLAFVASMGYELSLAELADGAAKDDIFGFLRPDDVGVVDRLFWDAFEPARLPAPKWVHGAREAVRIAERAGLRRAVCTSRHTPIDALVRELDALGGPPLDRVCSRGAGFADKTEMFAWVCRELDVPPAEAVAVGDTPADVLAARAAGVGCVVAVTTGACRRELLSATGADLVLPSIAALGPAWDRQRPHAAGGVA